MAVARLWLLLSLFACIAASVRAADPVTDDATSKSRAMSGRVDELLAARWKQEQAAPAPRTTDEEFLRRASLDLIGVIPTAGDVRDFQADDSPEKRAQLIDALLANPRHATHLANQWRNVLLPGDADIQQFGGIVGFHRWLRGKFAANVRYDNLVADLLVATGAGDEVGPALFYTSLDLKPETVAARTARIFLGVQIECAQCHDHPFDRWTQEDFWGYAAFFARLQRGAGGRQLGLRVVDGASGDVMIPGADDVAQPKFLNARQSLADVDDVRRRQLAIWLVSRDNPYFARATVNRIWAQLFGEGVVEPVDDIGPHNPPSHPKVLDELTDYFIASGFDLREVFRVLANTNAYQLSGRTADGEDPPSYLYARMATKSLTADQLYDSLLAVARRQGSNATGEFAGVPVPGLDAERLAFFTKFQNPTSGSPEFQAGIPQALTLMNGELMAEATDPERSGLLQALEAPYLTDADRIKALFLSTLSRAPAKEELAQFTEYVSQGGDRRQALGDVCWALLNSAEFMLNH